MDPFIGQIIMFAGNFAPKDWAFCDGQILPIAQNQALFAILGTQYGGDGRNTFALPDFRGRAPIGTGLAPGLTDRRLGERAGYETTSLTQANLPAHTHTAIMENQEVNVNVSVNAYAQNGGEDSPHDNYWAGASEEYSATSNTVMNAGAVTATASLTNSTISVGNTGNNIPFNNMQPFIGMNYIICLQGIFPSRS